MKPKTAAKAPKLNWKEKQELAGIESEIEKTDAEIGRIEAIFASPDFHRNFGQETGKLTEELAGLKDRLNQLFERWQALEERK